MKTATSIEDYKLTDEAKLKMLKRFENKSNHPTIKYISRKL